MAGPSSRFSVLGRWLAARKALSSRLSVEASLGIVLLAVALLAATARAAMELGPIADTAWAAVLTACLIALRAVVARYKEMANQLRAAHTVAEEYRTELEVRVDERTRQLQHLAEHDPLTGLPNRRQLWTYLETAIKSAPADAQVAVFFLDLDNFKNINDSMGHAFGDLVLQGIAQRLREATGGPGGFASRLGGDEFTVVYGTPGGLADISRVGSELVSAFQRPMLIEGRELLVSISVGASVYPEHAQTPDALLRAADAALFSAKNSGRSRFGMFNREMLETASLKFQIEQGLRRAVDRGEFELHFQPEVSFDSLGTTVVEALLRWRLPEGHYVAPGEFLPVAEESGLITSINDWVLRTAIQFGALWHHGAWPDARVAVNVSARQLLDTHFVDRVRELLSEHRLPPRCVEIELTETVLQTGPATVETLRELRQLGVSIALDDFGTGYSSIASLEKLPLTRVKLDRSLIASIDVSERSLAIARAIIGLCENLHLEVTAEGIERQQQLALLLGHRSMSLQGYLFARPMPAERLPDSVAGMPARLQSFLLEAHVPGTSKAADAPEPVRAIG
jgi:diguanylate cyclase (GGDEF)-like protein